MRPILRTIRTVCSRTLTCLPLLRPPCGTIVEGIALPNPTSVALHEACGFRPVGVFHEVGRKFDQWWDVGYWELVLEPSSGSSPAT